MTHSLLIRAPLQIFAPPDKLKKLCGPSISYLQRDSNPPEKQLDLDLKNLRWLTASEAQRQINPIRYVKIEKLFLKKSLLY